MTFESKEEETFWMEVYSRVLVAPGVDVDDAAKYSDQAVERLRLRVRQYAT